MAVRADSTVHPSLFTRLMARLRGEAAEPAPAAEPHLDRAASSMPATPVPPLDSLTIRQWLWGAGFHAPGNAEYALRLVKPFGLTPAMSLLDVAAGLGGAARAIAATFDTYITAFERDPDLARRGMALSVAAGQQKHAPVTAIDPESFELRTSAFDCIMGRGATYMVQDKERFMRVLILGLKQRGQLLLTDYVLDETLAERPELAMWSELQPYRPALWTLQQYVDCFKSLGFDLRITEEITHDLKMQIVLGWDNLLQTVNIRALPRQHKLAVVNEAESWVKTILALESGVVKAYRFYALAGSSRPPLSSIRKAGK
jgi:SAM-dependent methyltransferase